MHTILKFGHHFSMALPLAFLLFGYGCGTNSDAIPGDAAGVNPPPAECVLSAPPADWQYPPGPYGTELSDTFEDIELEDCDGNEVRLGDVLGQSEMILFNVGAGWCEPCIEESKTLDKEVFREFCGRGLQVVQVLFQDEQSRPATKLFCREWRDRYGLSFPVLVDPTFKTGRYFESVSAQTPQNFLISRTGEIVFKETGTPAADLPIRIDELLPN